MYFCIIYRPNPNESLKVGKWTNRDVHDVKFNEEKLSIQFKFGRMGAFGLAINWYNNLPFQAWELKPDVKKYIHLDTLCILYSNY